MALSLERTAKRLGDDLNETRQAANNIRAPRDPTCPKCVCVCEEEKKTTVK